MNNVTNAGTPIFVEACKKADEHKIMCIMLLDNGSDSGLTDEVNKKLFVCFCKHFLNSFFGC